MQKGAPGLVCGKFGGSKAGKPMSLKSIEVFASDYSLCLE